MIIYKADNTVLLEDIPITSSAEHVQELSKSDYVKLAWSDVSYYDIPVGSYIIPFEDGVKYSILESHKPSMRNEIEYVYEPEFQHPMMIFGYTPCLFKTKNVQGDDMEETDWSYTGTLTTIAQFIVDIINEQTGMSFAVVLMSGSDIPASATVSFGAVDILSALNSIASEFGTEYHIDWGNRKIYFGTIRIGEEITLEEGVNVGVSSKVSARDSKANYYIVRGGTRNITTETKNGSIETDTRLSIPDIDKRTDKLNEPALKKILIFDNVYPKLDLYVYDVRTRVRRLKDTNGNYVVKEYNPDMTIKSYQEYAIYYIRLAYQNKATGKWVDFKIKKDDIVKGKKLTASFEPNENGEHSALAGREFAMTYHDKNETISPNATIGDSGVIIKEGDYEINFVTEGELRIPDIYTLQPYGESTPSEQCDKVVLFNIVMSDDYLTSAKAELLTEAEKEIARINSDTNNYTVRTYPQIATSGLSVGRAVKYKALSKYELGTRIIKLATKLDCPSAVEITIGNSEIKGNTQTLKEEVLSANSNIAAMASMSDAVNNMTIQLQNAQNSMVEAMSKIAGMWQFDDKGNLFTKYNVYSLLDVSAFGSSCEYSAPVGVSYFKDLYDIKALGFGSTDNGKTVVWNGTQWVKGTAGDKVTKDAVVGALGFTPASAKDLDDVEEAFSGSLNDIDVRITELEGKTYVTSWNDLTDKPTTLAGYGITDKVLLEGALNGYATEQWVTDKGYLAQSDADKRYVDFTSAQTVTGVKTFSNGLRIGDAVLTFSDNKLTLTHKDSGKFVHLCASGDVVAYGTDPSQQKTVSYFKDLEDVKNPSSLNTIDAVWAKNGSTYGWKAATELGKTYVGSTYIDVSGTVISLRDDVVQAIGKGETAYGWGNHANAGYLTKHQTLQDLKLNYGERQATYNPRTGSTIDLPMFCVQGNLNNTDGKEVSAEEYYIDWECKNTDLLSKSSELGRDNGFMLLNHGMYRYYNWYSNNGKREVSSARALLNFYVSYISGTSLEVAWDYDANTPLKFRRTIDAYDPTRRRISHFWRAIVDESNIGTYMSDKKAGSADKLSNTKTLWGQNFDGTQNVSGNMTDVGSVTLNEGHSVYFSGWGSLKFKYGNTDYNMLHVNQNSGGVYLNYDGQKELGFCALGKDITLYTNGVNPRLRIDEDGNVGIGTQNPQYKLDVYGAGYFSGDVKANTYKFSYDDGVRLESGNVYFYETANKSWNVGYKLDSGSPTQFLSVYAQNGITMAHGGLMLGTNPTDKDANGLLWWDDTHNALRVNGNIIAKGDLIAFGGANLSDIGILNVTGVNAGYIGTGELRTTYGGVIKDYGDNGNMLISPKDTSGGAVVVSGHELLSEYDHKVNIGKDGEYRFGTAYVNGVNIKAPTGKTNLTITDVYINDSKLYFKVNGVQKNIYLDND